MSVWFAEHAWVDGAIVSAVAITVHDGVIAAVEPGGPPAGATRLDGIVLPGLVNAHSHAFHRALRGRTHVAGGDFWAWRDEMYRIAGSIDPGTLGRLATAVYAEMALAGITCVGEFHYLHHSGGGVPYTDPNLTGRVLVDAARTAGIRITLLDTAYLRGGLVDGSLDPVQRRFADADIDGWAGRVEALTASSPGDHALVGVAAHSVRALSPEEIAVVADMARRLDAPLHFHLSEQPDENAECLEVHRRTPAEVMADAGALGPTSTAVHATHVAGEDVALLGGSGTAVCMCPSTERDLGDGVGPAARLAHAGCPLALGTDAHSVIDLFEEARGVELDERLVTGRRGIHDPAALLTAATEGGSAALGWAGGAIRPGLHADFIAVSPDSVRLAGWRPENGVAGLVFAATAADVTDVVVGGIRVVEDGVHQGIEDVAGLLGATVAAATRMAT